MRMLLLWLALLAASGGARAQQEAPATPAIEVVVPALVTAGAEFPIVYRATPKVHLRLEKEFQTKSKEGALGQSRVTSPIVTASRWVHQASIQTPGYYLLTFQFKTDDGQTVSANARTKVLEAAPTAAFAGTAWELPRKNLYLSPEAFASWNQTPAPKREILALERAFFAPLLEQPDYDNSWYPLRAWNEMAELFQPRFLPPLSLVHAFENSSYLPVKYVAYATWSQGDSNFLYQAEIGGTSWLAIETPAAKAPPDLATVFQPALLPSAPSASPARSMVTRTLKRYRALTPEAPLTPITLQLIQLERPGALDLLLPGHRAPELPRLSVAP